MSVTVEDLDSDLLALHTCRILSLDDKPIGSGEGGALYDVLKATVAADPADSAGHQETVERLAKAICELPEVEEPNAQPPSTPASSIVAICRITAPAPCAPARARAGPWVR